MVAISFTTLFTAAVAFSCVEAIPTKYFGNLPGIESIQEEIERRAVKVSTLPTGAGGSLPLRRDFEEFAQDATALNLYLLALSRMQALPQSDPTSYYQIAGIHGRPYSAWDNVRGGNNNGGYCTHGDILFLSWHRPYLALYENILYNEVQKVAKEFRPGPDADRHLASATTWRMPYWDWATKVTIHPIIGNQPRVQVLHPTRGNIQIDNPLYSYKYNFTESNQPPQAQQLPDAPFNTARSTARLDYTTLNQRLSNIGDNLRTRVYNLLTAYTDYAAFSNKGTTTSVNGNLDSLESVHDVLHATVGGGKFEMGFVDYAAMDNLFFLHHTNIDRLFAIWQAMHPNSYLTPSSNFVNRYGTFAIPANTRETSDTGLAPFRKTDQSFYTSEDVKSTRAFGYAYPETVDWDKPADNFVAWVNKQVNEKYGKGSPAGILTSVSSSTNMMSSTSVVSSSTSTSSVVPTTTSSRLSSTSAPSRPSSTSAPSRPSPTVPAPRPPAPTATRPPQQSGPQTCANTPWYLWFWKGMWECFRTNKQGPHRNQKRDYNLSNLTSDVTEYVGNALDTVDTIVSNAIDALPDVADLIPIAASLISGDKYMEYIAQVKGANNALNGTYTVFFFLGDYSDDVNQWFTEKNLIGQHSAFTSVGGGHNFVGSGSVPLTATLINKVVDGSIANLGRDAVLPYLQKFLRWEVATASGEAVPSKDVKDLKVSIVSADVRLPCVDGALPLWGNPKTEYSITEGKDGGLSEGEEVV